MPTQPPLVCTGCKGRKLIVATLKSGLRRIQACPICQGRGTRRSIPSMADTILTLGFVLAVILAIAVIHKFWSLTWIN